VSFKARLLYIGWIKVDGKPVYKDESKTAENDAQETEAPASEPAVSDVEAPSAAAENADAATAAESF